MNQMPSNNEVKEIAALAERQLLQQRDVEMFEHHLKEAQAALRQTQEVDLPNAMQQAGVSEIKLPTGEKITIKDDVYASIPKDERYHEAMDWLRANGFGDIIKNEVKVAFGRGEETLSEEAILILRANGFDNITTNVTVHAQTLKALIREQLAKGKDFPMELFGAVPVSKAVIK